MDNPKLIFLSIILIVLLSSYLIAMRNNLTKLFKSAAVWVIIFSCFVAGYGVWQDLSKEKPVLYSNNLSDIIINIKQDGHFHATVLVNNVEIEFFRSLKHPLHFLDAARIPAADVAVEVGSTFEHLPHGNVV